MKTSEFRKLIREEVRKVLRESIGLADFDFSGFTSFLKSTGIQSKEFYDVSNYGTGRYGGRPSFGVVGDSSLLKDFKKLKSLPPEKQRQIVQYFKGPKKLDSFEKTYGSVQIAIQPNRNGEANKFWITSETNIMMGSGLNKKPGFQDFFIRWIEK